MVGELFKEPWKDLLNTVPLVWGSKGEGVSFGATQMVTAMVQARADGVRPGRVAVEMRGKGSIPYVSVQND